MKIIELYEVYDFVANHRPTKSARTNDSIMKQYEFDLESDATPEQDAKKDVITVNILEKNINGIWCGSVEFLVNGSLDADMNRQRHNASKVLSATIAIMKEAIEKTEILFFIPTDITISMADKKCNMYSLLASQTKYDWHVGFNPPIFVPALNKNLMYLYLPQNIADFSKISSLSETEIKKIAVEFSRWKRTIPENIDQ